MTAVDLRAYEIVSVGFETGEEDVRKRCKAWLMAALLNVYLQADDHVEHSLFADLTPSCDPWTRWRLRGPSQIRGKKGKTLRKMVTNRGEKCQRWEAPWYPPFLKLAQALATVTDNCRSEQCRPHPRPV